MSTNPQPAFGSTLGLGDETAPPWHYNPSSWRQRLPICALGALTGLIAMYLAAYQWRWVSTVWDPVFGEQTARVLDSDVSEKMRNWILIPDAALGAVGYFSEAILALAASTRRWRERPWLVILFGIDVIPLGLVSVVLVVMQGTVVGSWCFLCLVTAVVSLFLVAIAYDEVWSSIVYLRDVRRRTRAWRPVWDAFWGRTAEATQEARGPTRLIGFWPRWAEIALGFWLASGAFLLPGSGEMGRTIGLIVGAAVVACSAASLLPACNKLHLANIVIALGLVGYLLFAAPRPATPDLQNLVFTALVLVNFAVVPNERIPARRKVGRWSTGSLGKAG
jgi:hypothetical protein